MWSSSPARAVSSTPGCGAVRAGFRLDVADELPDDFIEKSARRRQAGQPGKVPAGRGVGGCHHQVRLCQRRTYLLGKGWTA